MNIFALLAGLFSGTVGAMGLGGGAVLVIYLALFTDTKQLKAQGINLLFFIPIGLLAVIAYAIKKEIKWKITLPIALFGLIGTVIGLNLTNVFGGAVTAKIFGGMLCLLGIREVFAKKIKTEDCDSGDCSEK